MTRKFTGARKSGSPDNERALPRENAGQCIVRGIQDLVTANI